MRTATDVIADIVAETTVKPINLFQELIDNLMAEIRAYLQSAKAKLDLEQEQKYNGTVMTFLYRPKDTVYNWRDDPDMTSKKYGFASKYEEDLVEIMKADAESTSTENCTAKTKALLRRTLEESGIIQSELTKGEGWAGKYDSWLNVNQSALQLMSQPEQVTALSIALGLQKIRFAIEAEEQKRAVQQKAADKYAAALKKLEEEKAARKLEAEQKAKADAETNKVVTVTEGNLLDISLDDQPEQPQELLPPKVEAPAERRAEDLRKDSYKKILANLVEFLFRTIYDLQIDAAKTVQVKLSHSREVPKEVAIPMIALLAKKIADINATQVMFEGSEQRFANVAAHTAELLGVTGKMHDSLRSFFLPSAMSYNPFMQKFGEELQQFDAAIRGLDPTVKIGSKLGLVWT